MCFFFSFVSNFRENLKILNILASFSFLLNMCLRLGHLFRNMGLHRPRFERKPERILSCFSPGRLWTTSLALASILLTASM